MSRKKHLSLKQTFFDYSVPWARHLKYFRYLLSALIAKGTWNFLIVSVAVGLSSTLSAQTNQLSGTLNLPEGVVPTNQELVFRIQTEQLDSFLIDGNPVTSSTTVTIPVLQNSTSFSLPLLDFPEVGLDDAKRTVKFDCLVGCSNIAITTTGYWGGIQGVVGQSDAQTVDSALSQSITIDLERADLFRGVINFPEGVSASGDETFRLVVSGSQFSSPPVFFQTIEATADATNLAFFIGVPPGQTGGSWLLSLECEACAESIPIGPYYPTTNVGDPLSSSRGDRFFHIKNRSYSNLRFTLPAPPIEPRESVPVQGIISILLDEE